MEKLHHKTGSIELAARPLIMGIHNATPDSFSDGKSGLTLEESIRHCLEMLEAGADIIDIGGESTRPGDSAAVPAEEELHRVIPVIKELKTLRPECVISIDTMKPQVAIEAVNAGADMINDVSGLKYSDRIAGIAAQTGSALVLMHMKSAPKSDCEDCVYENLIEDIKKSLLASALQAESAGVDRKKIILDPGLGGGSFGKDLRQNLEIISRIDEFKALAYPILIGASRKGFLGKLINEPEPRKRLPGNLAVAAWAALKNVDIIRVHDVKETMQFLKTFRTFAARK